MAEFVQSEMKVIKPDGAILVSPESLETFWSELGDIPVDDDGIIQESFLWWPKETDREDIWRWFDEKYPGGVAKLMGLEKNKMTKYDEVIKKLEEIGFKVKEEYDLDSQYIVLERTVEQHNTHQVVIEDHRYERAEKDFDPKRDIGDWLIFSSLTDDEHDWFGRFVETQYPLKLEEVHLIEELITCLEEKCTRMLDEAGV